MIMGRLTLFYAVFGLAMLSIVLLRDCSGGGGGRGDTALDCSRRGQPSGYNPSTGRWECGGR